MAIQGVGSEGGASGLRSFVQELLKPAQAGALDRPAEEAGNEGSLRGAVEALQNARGDLRGLGIGQNLDIVA